MGKYALIVLLPLIPAVVIGLLFGIVAKAQGGVFGTKFTLGGGAAAYAIFLLISIFGYNQIKNDDYPTYELTLNLRGEQAERDAVIATLAAVKVTLTAPSGQPLVFSGFAAGASQNELRSSVIPPVTLPSGTYRASVSPERTDRVILQLADASLTLRTQMQLTLDVKPRNDDPLTTDAVPFSRDDWVVSFQGSQANLAAQGDKHVEEFKELLVFRNETAKPLSLIRLTGYQIAGSVEELEAEARTVPGSIADAGLVDFRGKTIGQLDTGEILAKLDATRRYFSERGGQIGYFLYRDEKLVSDKERTKQFELLDGHTLRASILPPVQPGDAVAIMVRMKIRPDEDSLAPGKSDRFGVLTPYPTRLGYLVASSTAPDRQIDPSATTVEINAREGRKASMRDDYLLKKSATAAIFGGALMDRDVTVRLHWIWDQGKKN